MYRCVIVIVLEISVEHNGRVGLEHNPSMPRPRGSRGDGHTDDLMTSTWRNKCARMRGQIMEDFGVRDQVLFGARLYYFILTDFVSSVTKQDLYAYLRNYGQI